MRDGKKRFYIDNKGSSLITALVVSAVLLVLCLSLLLVSYTLFSEVNEQDLEMPKRELAYSVAEEIEQELFDVDCKYSNEEEMQAFYEASKDELWKYVRYNIWQNFGPEGQLLTGDTWLYYDEAVPGHNNLEECSRYFSLDTDGTASKITVQLYWSLPKDFDKDTEKKDGTVLHAVYRLYEDDEVSYKIEREYVLGVGDIEPEIVYRYRVSFNSNGHGTAPEPQTVNENEKAVEPVKPDADGYDFEGWYTDAECSPQKRFDFNTPITENIILYAKWTRTLFDITFAENGHGTAPETQHISYMQKAVRPADPAAEGYLFGGWYLKPSCADADLYDFDTPVTKDITLYAKWVEVNYYTVSFNMNGHGNQTVDSQKVAEGECAVEPAEPLDKKMNFAGWYMDADCTAGNSFSFATPITGDVVLFAKWTSGCVVTFVINNPNVNARAPEPQTMGKGEKAYQPADPVDTDGYFTFVKWYKDEACVYEYNFRAAVTESINIYADWRRIAYRVTFDGNGHGSVPAPGPVLIGQPISRPSDPVAAGYSFVGWYRDAKCTAGNEWDFSTVISNADVTLYAKWTPVDYNIYYVLNDSAAFKADNGGNSTRTSFTVESEDITFAEPVRTGYDFDGWYDAANGGNKVTDLWKGSRTSDLTLYARWTPHSYSISYYLNDADGMAADNTVNAGTAAFTVESGDISFAAPTRKGYEFDGWYDALTGGNKVTGITTGSRSENLSLYARYTVIPYTITYENIGAADNSANPATYTVEDEIIFDTSLSREGYKPFEGWLNSSNEKVVGLAKGSTGNITLKGKWTPIEYTVTYVTNGGTNSNLNPAVYTVESADISFRDASKYGYDFAGWYDSETGGSRISGIAKGSRTGNLTLYARWTPTVYRITYVLDNGTNNAANPSTYTIEDSVTFGDPSKGPESTFIGWFTNANPKLGTNVTSLPKGSTGDRTLYAVWVTTTFNVTYMTNTEAGTVNTKVEYNMPASAPSGLTKTGYNLAGWYQSADFSGSKWNFATGITAPLTLYAEWQKNRYTVSFNAMGGSAVDPVQVEYDDNASKPEAPVRSGYNFAGWYKDRSCTEVWDFAVDTVTGDITLYAKWTALLVVTFEANNPDVRASMPLPVTVESGRTVSKPVNPVDDCFTFVDWYTDADCSKLYNFSAPVTANLTLYAKWTRSRFRVTFDYAGLREPYEVTVANNATVARPNVTLPADYTLVNYYTDPTYRTTWNFNTRITADTTIYCKLTPVTYTVTFYGNKPSASWLGMDSSLLGLLIYSAISVENVPSAQTLVKNSLVTEPGVPYVQGAITSFVYAYFKGWYKDSSGTVPFDFDNEKVTENIKLYAAWVKPEEVEGKPAVSAQEKAKYQTDFKIWYASNSERFIWSNEETAWKYWYHYVRDTRTADASSGGAARFMGQLLSTEYIISSDNIPVFKDPAGVCTASDVVLFGPKEAPCELISVLPDPVLFMSQSGANGGEDGDLEPLYIYRVPDTYKPVSASLNPNNYEINPRELWKWKKP